MRDAGPPDPFAALQGAAPALAVHEGVLALPDQLKRRPLICGLFDDAGAELPGSQCWLDGSTPATLPPGERPAATEKLTGTHLFGGVVSRHFGHVLCGGTARLWALDHSPCAVDGIVFFGRDPEMPNRLATRARGILGAFGIDLPVRISIQKPYVTVSTPVAKGDILSESVLTQAYQDQTLIRGDYLSDTTALIGVRSKRELKPGQPIRLSQVCVVCKGDQVTLSAENSSMQIKTMARALQDGSFGDMIRLVNIRSGKTVQGKVNAVGSVVVTF